MKEKTKLIRIDSIVSRDKNFGEIIITNLPKKGTLQLPVNKSNEFGVIEQYVELHAYPWDESLELNFFLIYQSNDFFIGKMDNKFLIFYKSEEVVIAHNIPEWMFG